MQDGHIPAGPQDAEKLSGLAFEIWREHYAGMLPKGQIEYMIERFQSAGAISEQMGQGYRYYFMAHGGRMAGYFGFVPDEKGLFLSKLYIHRDFRRRGLGRAAMEFVFQAVRDIGAPKVYLTVNRGNSGSIAAYRAYGFEVESEQDADIGQGYVMNDYVMSMATT